MLQHRLAAGPVAQGLSRRAEVSPGASPGCGYSAYSSVSHGSWSLFWLPDYSLPMD